MACHCYYSELQSSQFHGLSHKHMKKETGVAYLQQVTYCRYRYIACHCYLGRRIQLHRPQPQKSSRVCTATAATYCKLLARIYVQRCCLRFWLYANATTIAGHDYRTRLQLHFGYTSDTAVETQLLLLHLSAVKTFQPFYYCK